MLHFMFLCAPFLNIYSAHIYEVRHDIHMYVPINTWYCNAKEKLDFFYLDLEKSLQCILFSCTRGLFFATCPPLLSRLLVCGLGWEFRSGFERIFNPKWLAIQIQYISRKVWLSLCISQHVPIFPIPQKSAVQWKIQFLWKLKTKVQIHNSFAEIYPPRSSRKNHWYCYWTRLNTIHSNDARSSRDP